MANLAPGTLYTPESAAEIRDDLLTDFRLASLAVGIEDPEISVQPGSENYFFFTAVANSGMLQYANIATVKPALTPLTATGEDLENWRKSLKLPVVEPSPATGKITVDVDAGATLTLQDGLQFVLPSGLRGKVSGTQPGVVDNSDANVAMIDPGSSGNADAGTVVRWVSPPFGLKTEGRVSASRPLAGGYDQETEPRKRERVLNRLGTSAGGGNWGQLREQAFNALASVSDCWVYPAIGGPSTVKVVVARAFDEDRHDYSRAMTDAAVALVKDEIQRQNGDGFELVVQTPGEQDADLVVYVTLPNSSLAGGNGQGWVDQSPWPPAGSGTHPAVTSAADANTITVNATTAVEPIDGLTHVSWWAPGEQKFYTALVVDHSGSSGAWVLTLDAPFVDADGVSVAVGDYISPAAVNMGNYGKTFVALMGKLGAGENCAPLSGDTPRRLRHPFIADVPNSTIGGRLVNEWSRQHPEIEAATLAYAPTSTPTVPASVDTAPNILVPRHFGIQKAS
jgi:uncharacterized phage protein gp47/JayE